jgi:hypothetical protein
VRSVPNSTVFNLDGAVSKLPSGRLTPGDIATSHILIPVHVRMAERDALLKIRLEEEREIEGADDDIAEL